MHVGLQPGMGYLLHLDTSADKSIIALSRDGKLVCRCDNGGMQQQAASINLTIQQCLHLAGITFASLDAVVACGGPGSYTGVRICLATTKGLCYALDIPLMLHHKLKLMAWQAYEEYNTRFKYYLSVIKARENEYFTGLYKGNDEEPVVMELLTGEQLVLLISEYDYVGVPALPGQNTSEIIPFRDDFFVIEKEIAPEIWADYAYKEYKKQKFENLFSASPFYMKNVYFYK